jgi:hypothetical protein
MPGARGGLRRATAVSRVVGVTAFATLAGLGLNGTSLRPAGASPGNPGVVAHAAAQASQRYGVPEPLPLALCQFEGRLSNDGGSPNRDNGYGCMHLVKNSQGRHPGRCSPRPQRAGAAAEVGSAD